MATNPQESSKSNSNNQNQNSGLFASALFGKANQGGNLFSQTPNSNSLFGGTPQSQSSQGFFGTPSQSNMFPKSNAPSNSAPLFGGITPNNSLFSNANNITPVAPSPNSNLFNSNASNQSQQPLLGLFGGGNKTDQNKNLFGQSSSNQGISLFGTPEIKQDNGTPKINQKKVQGNEQKNLQGNNIAPPPHALSLFNNSVKPNLNPAASNQGNSTNKKEQINFRGPSAKNFQLQPILLNDMKNQQQLKSGQGNLSTKGFVKPDNKSSINKNLAQNQKKSAEIQKPKQQPQLSLFGSNSINPQNIQKKQSNNNNNGFNSNANNSNQLGASGLFGNSSSSGGLFGNLNSGAGLFGAKSSSPLPTPSQPGIGGLFSNGASNSLFTSSTPKPAIFENKADTKKSGQSEVKILPSKINQQQKSISSQPNSNQMLQTAYFKGLTSTNNEKPLQKPSIVENTIKPNTVNSEQNEPKQVKKELSFAGNLFSNTNTIPIVTSKPKQGVELGISTLKATTQKQNIVSGEQQPPSLTSRQNESEQSNLSTIKANQKKLDFSTTTKITNLTNNSKKTNENTLTQKVNLSFLQGISIRTQQILDYKTLQQQQKKQLFSTFLTQTKTKINKSIKMYFTIRQDKFKYHDNNNAISQYNRFIIDLTNIIIKNLGLNDQSWNLLHKFIKRIIKDQKYQKYLFNKDQKLNIQYFKTHKIYTVDYNNNYTLNQNSSKQLQLLMEKIINKWNIQIIQLINFMLIYPELFYKPEDLFKYLFKYLLSMDYKNIQTNNLTFQTYIKDFQIICRQKLIGLISYYNPKLKTYYQLLTSDDLKTIIKLIQNNKIQQLNQISLKVLLNHINFNKPKEIPNDLFDCIKQSKSFAMMPLRALTYRLNPKKQQFVPNPKDLYKYIKGDEWIDWFDIYLSQSKQGIDLQIGEAEYIIQSLSTIRGSLISQRMINAKKGVGILKFFNLLRDENMICIYNEKSIGEIQQFYFKKMNFNLQYQQVIQYIINFNENKKYNNQNYIISIFQIKISLLIKILQIQPQKLIQLEHYLFYNDYHKFKKFKNNQILSTSRQQGQKIIHLFLDTINIVSIKNLPTIILHKIFKVLTILLKNKQTQKIVLNSMKINRPSFLFTQNQIHHSTLNTMNQLLEQILSTNYIYDLIFTYQQSKEQEIRMEGLYPFRYKDTQYNNLYHLQNSQKQQQPTLSIYWLNQMIKILTKQKYNPYLIYKLLQIFYIIPYNGGQFITQNNSILYHKQKSYDTKIPTIFQNIINILNQLTIWENISKILQFKIIKKQGKLDIVNKIIIHNNSIQNFKCLLHTVKLIRIIFKLSNLLVKYQETSSNHFIIKTLSAIHFLSRSKITSLFASTSSKNSMILSIIAGLQFQKQCSIDSLDIKNWQAQQRDQQFTYQTILSFIKINRKTIDFQLANNYFKYANNDLYQSDNSLISASLDILIQIINLSKQTSIQYTLTNNLILKQQQKIQLKNEIINKFIKIIQLSINNIQINYKIIQFIYNLKYNSNNQLHYSLSNKLFDQFIKYHQIQQYTPKFHYILLSYLFQELINHNLKYQNYTQRIIQNIIINFKFKDNFINKFRQFRQTHQIGKMIKSYHSKKHGLLNLNQIERIIEEKAIIQIGYQFQYLKIAVDIIVLQILRRKQSQSLINCIQQFNLLILKNNMLLLQKDLPEAFKIIKLGTKFDHNIEPRLYLRDPIELYITQTRNIKNKSSVQIHQKNNIIQWIIDKCHNLSQKITNYIKFILTIDRYFYSNNPISFTLEKNQVANLELFSHLALGKINFTSIEIFGKSSSDSIDAVQGMASNLIIRLVDIRKLLGYHSYIDKSFKEGLKILGFCLQWLRGKQKYNEDACIYVIRKLQKNYSTLLPDNNYFLNNQAIKVLLSALSMGSKYFSPESKGQIRLSVYALVQKYWQKLQKGKNEEDANNLGEVVQLALSLLILIPPQKNETKAIELLINIWIKQKNFQFFFNQSRLILELTSLYPEQVVKLQPLTRCEIVSNLSNFYSRYDEEGERRYDSIAWTWIVKIAAQLINHPLSILVITQVSAFYKIYKQRFINLFEVSDKLTKSYVQDLEAALQLLACLFSHDLWVNFNRKLAEQLTYLLSHKLIKVFTTYAQGKLKFITLSNNDQNLAKVKCLGIVEQVQNADNLAQDNMFAAQTKIKFNHCLRNYCIVMRKAFKSSHYVQQYFEKPVFDNYKYFSSFWDLFNKNLIALFIYAGKQFKIWNSVKKLNDTLGTLQECHQAPHTFVQNGYLNTMIELPKNEYELFSDIYLMNYLLCDLAAVHFLKEKLYVIKYNSLLANHIDTFGKKIKEHCDYVKVQSKRINASMNLYVKEEDYFEITDIVEASKIK